MSVLVLCDAFIVVVPGEIAVTALGALSIAHGAPPLPAVIALAACAAWAGDAGCYLVGRLVGLQRWGWMRGHRMRRAFGWARRRLDTGTATVLFTARFVPFARLAVNLVAGASRVHPPRYLALAALAAAGWAAYQAAVGAVIAALVPGGPLVAMAVSVVAAVLAGLLIDLAATRRRGDGVLERLRRRQQPAAAPVPLTGPHAREENSASGGSSGRIPPPEPENSSPTDAGAG
ncbi:VTT domain-containing protein [Microbacterium sp. EF45047]|nr:VTT domain-containing protein [Microbacterium neungamense]WCM56805.1 VTT domain-containing protein [Microbacterium sp. EF45047]